MILLIVDNSVSLIFKMSETNLVFDLFLDIKFMKKDSFQKALKQCKYTLQTLYTSSILNMIVETISMVLIEPLFTVRPKYLSLYLTQDLHKQSKHIYFYKY